jgi:hypothetical protein
MSRKINPCLSGLTLALALNLAEAGQPAPYEFTPKQERLVNYHAKRIGVDSSLLYAIRRAEGNNVYHFGIIPTPKYIEDAGYRGKDGNFQFYADEFEKQLVWSAWTIRKNMERFQSSGYKDFISFLKSRYTPNSDKRDVKKLNPNWGRNVREIYRKHSGKKTPCKKNHRKRQK